MELPNETEVKNIYNLIYHDLFLTKNLIIGIID